MEYQFTRTLTGEYRIKCSMDHEVVGRWLEQEVYTDKTKINEILITIGQIKSGDGQEFCYRGKEISLSMLHGEVIIEENVLSTEQTLDDNEFDFYNSESSAGCGLEDFEQLLRSWLLFIR